MAYYSFEFAAKVTFLCIEEIQVRGLKQPKIFKKSVPNNGLCIKVFNRRTCTKEDLSFVDIHSVATLMKEALWSSHERIISKKVWRTINYETCTLSKLSPLLTEQGEELLVSLLDFLVKVIQYKHINLMNASHLGDALGKVVLGPSDCSPIMEEKAGHFLTRLIIEHAKIQQKQITTIKKKEIRRIDSGIDYSSYQEYHPLSKSEGTQLRAKYYNRMIKKTKRTNKEWCENVTGIDTMFDDTYDTSSDLNEQPWISIFTPAESLLKPTKDMVSSPILYRIIRCASQPMPEKSSDPFSRSYLFDDSKVYSTENQIRHAFTEFDSIIKNTNHRFVTDDTNDKFKPFKKLNHSISHLKLNIKKIHSRQNLTDESQISDGTTVVDNGSFQSTLQQAKSPNGSANPMRNIMKKMIHISGDRSSKKNSSPNQIAF